MELTPRDVFKRISLKEWLMPLQLGDLLNRSELNGQLTALADPTQRGKVTTYIGGKQFMVIEIREVAGKSRGIFINGMQASGDPKADAWIFEKVNQQWKETLKKTHGRS